MVLRRAHRAALATIAVLGFGGLQAGAAQAATHYYQDLSSRATGRVANVGFLYGSKDSGEPVRLGVDTGPHDWNNQWEEVHTESSSSWRSLKNRWSGLCMDVASTDNGAAVFQAPCDATRSQKWRSRYDLTSSNSWGAWESKWADHVGKRDRVLTINSLADPTSPLVLWKWYGGHDQQWHYETEAQSG